MSTAWIGILVAAVVLGVLWWLITRYEMATAREIQQQVAELEDRLKQVVRDIQEAEEAFSQQLRELAEQKKAQEKKSS